MQSALNRGLYFAVYGLTLVLTFCALLLVGWAMPYRVRQQLATLWPWFMSTSWLKLATGIRVRLAGQDNVPGGPYVAVCNHQSEWETLYLARLLCPASIVMKESLLRIPIYGWGQRLFRPIAIDRSSPRASIKAILTQGKQCLAGGSNVLIFPEGTRVAPGSVRKYGRTAFKLAVREGVPLVPVVQNSGDFWLKKTFRPGTIEVVIGTPIYPQGLSADELCSQVENWSRHTYAGFSDAPETANK